MTLSEGGSRPIPPVHVLALFSHLYSLLPLCAANIAHQLQALTSSNRNRF